MNYTLSLYLKRFSFYVFVLSLLVVISGCTNNEKQESRPKVVAGKIDLSNWNFAKQGAITLSGEYEFYWQKLISPEFISNNAIACDFIQLPRVWNKTHIKEGLGYGTYRLSVILPRTEEQLALKIPDISTACDLFLNGVKVFSAGKVGVTKETSSPQYLSKFVNVPPDTGKLDLIFHVSNFFHCRGGISENIKIGTPEQLRNIREMRIALDLVLFGAIMIMGLYHIVIYNFKQKDRSFLFFGLFCLLISIRLLTTDENYLLSIFPNLNWYVFARIEYITYYFGVPIFTLFLDNLFPSRLPKPARNAIILLGCLFSVIVLLTPPLFFTATLDIFHIYTIVVIIYGIILLSIWSINKIEGAGSILTGFLFLSIAVINDILDGKGIIQTGHFVHYGLFLFIFFQAALLSYRFSKTFNIVESQRQNLVKANEKYKHELHERKKAEKTNKELEEKLNRAQKMEAIGLLAGGVAHDLNNILAGTVTYPDLLLSDLPESSDLYKPLETIKSAGLKAAAVVQDLLTLARRGVINLEPIHLNAVVKEYLNSPEFHQLQREHTTVDIQFNLERNLCNIKGSSVHLKKAIMNLVNNAAEAQPKGGTIFISTQNHYFDKRFNGYEDIPEGNYVTLMVKDLGMGIEPGDLKKIFEPFYTKKIMGRSGTGLGMSVVWGTVHDHGGHINVTSEMDSGTEFTLYFPITNEELIQQEHFISLESLKGHKQSILVIDDVEEQREIASHILTKLNYSVATVSSGEDAELYLKDNSVDLILLDMIMDPGIDGLETYQRILKLHPGQKAIIASGFSETDRVKTAISLGVGRYIKKPYTVDKLGQAVKEEFAQHTVADKQN